MREYSREHPNHARHLTRPLRPGFNPRVPRARSLSLGLSVCPSARLFIAVLVMMPLAVHANPVMIDGQSLIAFGIVAFWALVIESGIVTLALISSGVLILPLFGTLVIANVAVFLLAFLPLTSRVSLWLLEPGVVLADALMIKLVASAAFLQGGNFVGVSWRRALVASLVGNAVSYFIGLIGSHAPWIVHETGVLE